MTVRQAPIPIERDSVFGDTYNGVPNFMTAVEHGYPTRFHGPIYKTPQVTPTWAWQPYAKAPFAGNQGLGATTGLGTSLTGSRLFDAMVGLGVGFFGSPSRSQAPIHGAVAGVAGYLMGVIGIGAVLGFELYQCKRKG